MKFCPECSSFCVTDSSKKQAVCSKCGHIVELENPKELKNKKIVDGKIVVVTENLRRLNSLPRGRRKCPKCGNTEVFIRILAARGEEDYEEECYRCTKCGHSWREGN